MEEQQNTQNKNFTFEVSVTRIELCAWEAMSHITQKKIHFA